MITDNLNATLRAYVKNNISITIDERNFISSIYQSLQHLLGSSSTIQIGSYPRFTAIRPLHDLDILYVCGNWNEQNHNPNPKVLLEGLLSKVRCEYRNPTKHRIELSLQTHSVGIVFKDVHDNNIFSVDIVPAFVSATNEFNQDTYMVPEILRHNHGQKRRNYYDRLSNQNIEMNWTYTDPRGYIESARQENVANDDFRKTVKFIKAWKGSCKEKNDDFGLKSFHIEQVITGYFHNTTNLNIFDALFKFFFEIPQIIEEPQIRDRANRTEYIDKYLGSLTEAQKDLIIQARDCFLKNLENFSEDYSTQAVQGLIDACSYKRASDSEQFLFDFNIPVLVDDKYSFTIIGDVQERNGGFRAFKLDSRGLIRIDRKIRFKINEELPNIDLFKWKVKNDNSSQQPRGEITDHHTLSDPEYTKYRGNHYIECYAILNNICVAKAKQNVKLIS